MISKEMYKYFLYYLSWHCTITASYFIMGSVELLIVTFDDFARHLRVLAIGCVTPARVQSRCHGARLHFSPVSLQASFLC